MSQAKTLEMVKVLSTLLSLPGSKPRHRTTKAGKRLDTPRRRSTREQRKGTGDRGRVREPQRRGMSQGIMI